MSAEEGVCCEKREEYRQIKMIPVKVNFTA
jgi:hypothetical protein